MAKKKKADTKALSFGDYASNIWQPLGTSTFPFQRPLDIFGSQAAPTDLQLVQVFDDVVYACANGIAENFSKVPVKLYLRQGPGDSKRWKGKKNCKPISQKRWAQLAKSRPELTRKAQDIYEIDDHEIWDFLSDVCPYLTWQQLQKVEKLYQLIVGASYTAIHEAGNLPDQLWVLPAQYVKPKSDDPGKRITHYVFLEGTEAETIYARKDVIVFSEPDLYEPYICHYSPLRAAYERVKLAKSELSYFQQILINAGRPDVAVTVNDKLAPNSAERLVKQFAQIFRASSGGAGGPAFIPAGLDVKPLSFSPNTVYDVEYVRMTKETICNVFSFPAELLAQSSNFATYQGAMRKLNTDVIIPALRQRDETYNKMLVGRFQDDRLFLASDEPTVEEEPDQKRNAIVSLVGANLLTFNEGREELGEEPVEGGDKFNYQVEKLPTTQLLAPPTPDGRQEQAHEGTALPSDPAQQQGNRLELGKAILELQEAHYGGGIPREAAIANAVLLGVTSEEAAKLFPVAEPEHKEPVPEPLAQEQPPQDGVKTLKALTPDPGYEDEIRRQAAEFFRGQERRALDRLAQNPDADDLIDPAAEAEAMQERLFPVISIMADRSAQDFITSYGLVADTFRVVQPKLREAAALWCGELCASTQATTDLEIRDAIARTRAYLVEGATSGARLATIADAVREVFARATVEKSWQIARTESARMTQQAVRITGDESGVVKSYKWRASTMDVCPICLELNGTEALPGQPFATIGTGPYAAKWGGDAHPNCRCYIEPQLIDRYTA